MKISTFTSHLRLKESSDFISFWTFANVFLIFIGFLLLGSRFIFSPGLNISLPQVPKNPSAVPTMGVLNLANDQLFFFENYMLPPEDLPKALEQFLAINHQTSAVLLIRPDKNVSVATLCKVCSIAKQSGFHQVQVACLEKTEKK